MKYINIDNLFSGDIDPKYLPLLLILQYGAKEDLSDKIAMLVEDDQALEKLEKDGYIKYVKGTKSQTDFQKMRLDKKGTEYLNSLEEVRSTEDDEKFRDWLVDVYKKNGKTIKNKKELLRRIAWFREFSGIERRSLVKLLQLFLAEQEETDFQYSHDVANVFWKPRNAFDARYSLEQSRLWGYYEQSKEKFDKIFKKL